MKGIRTTTIILITALTISGCSLKTMHNDALDLPPNPQSFRQVYFEDDGETSIEINGRTYSYFGRLEGKMSCDSVMECLGYIDNDKDTRVYSLTDDPLDNFLMVKHIGGIMDQPEFLRAKDTIHENILAPYYIKSACYEGWGSSGIHYEMASATIGLVCNAENVTEIEYEFLINGESAGIGGVRYADKKEIKKGELFEIDIDEIRVNGKADKDEPFTISVKFDVIGTDGQIHDVKGIYVRDMMLGASLNDLEIRYDDNSGYYLYEDI